MTPRDRPCGMWDRPSDPSGRRMAAGDAAPSPRPTLLAENLGKPSL